MKRPCLLFLLTVCSIAACWAGGPELPPSLAEIPGLGTMAVVDSPVPVANGGTGVTDAAGARAAFDVYSKAETDSLAAQSTLRYYFDETDSDVVGYEAFATAPVAVQASEAITLATSSALIDVWITPANTPNVDTLVTGIYEIEQYITKTGNGTSNLIAELWSRDTGGTETFIATSSAIAESGIISTPKLIFPRFSIEAPVTLAHTDRLVVKLYGYRGAVASGLVIWYGNSTGSFFGVPISPRNFMRIDGSNAEAAAARVALGVVGSSATVLTSGANAMSGVLKFSANGGICADTNDGADTKYTLMNGGGSGQSERGAYVLAVGNEYAGSINGRLYLSGGNASNSMITFDTGSGTVSERMRITPIGKVGIASAAPVFLLSMEAAGGGYYDETTHQWVNGTCLEERKFDIQPVDFDPIAAINKLEIKKYKYKKYVEERHPITGEVVASGWVEDPDAVEAYGYIADDVPTELNKMISAQGNLGTRDAFAFLAAVCRAQQAQISSLTSRIEALEATP